MDSGNFALDFDLGLGSMDFLADTNDDEWLSTIDFGQFGAIQASSLGDHSAYQKMEESLQQTEDLPAVETPSSPAAKRFKSVSSDEITKYESMHQSEATKKNTQWGMRILQEWHKETYGSTLDLTEVDKGSLSEKLAKFYCEGKPKDAEKRSTSMPMKHAEVYHKNTLKNLRAAINRHLQDMGHTIDIVNDKEFKRANSVLDGMLKERTQNALSRPTQHKPIIDNEDLSKINAYFEDAEMSPIKLRQSVWYNIAIHFVTRGLEFHHQLQMESFNFLTDEDGSEYVTLTHETQQKNFQGGLNSKEALSDKRMYATGERNCPVKLLNFFMNKTNKNASSLFNACEKEAISRPDCTEVWYTSKPLSKVSFRNFMADISKYAKCSNRYTAHCLRSTAIQAMNDAGLEARHIMFMSGHRNEASIRPYNRDCSKDQKKSISGLLSNVASGKKTSTALCPVENLMSPHPQIAPSASASRPGLPAPLPRQNHPNEMIPVTNDENNIRFSSSFMSSVHANAGFLSNSAFSYCTFNFNH